MVKSRNNGHCLTILAFLTTIPCAIYLASFSKDVREIPHTTKLLNNVSNCVLVSIGSTSRPEPSRAQRETLNTRVALHQFDENNLAKCVICNSSHVGAAHFTLTSARLGESDGWWCAQKRPLLALYETLKGLNYLPLVLIVIDDDTFVNPVNLWRWVEANSVDQWDEQRYIGHKGDATMVMGGGGSALSRGALSIFRGERMDWAPLRWCISQTQGGAWCHWHSDWSIGGCYFKWTGKHAENSHLFTQLHSPCTENHITCHERKTYEEWMATWHRFVEV